MGAAQAVVLDEGGSQATEYLVGRELCLFLRVDLRHVPVRQRAGAVAMAVRRAAPFADPEHDIALMGGVAAVWYWSQARVRALAGSVGGRDRFRAEALFVGGPHDEADQLLSLPGGAEGRLWREGSLLASRHWPHAPDASQWQQFLRGAGLDPTGAVVPTPAPVAIAGTAWQASGASPGDVLGRLAPHAPAIAGAAGLVVLAAFAWQFGSGLRALWGLAEAERRAGRVEAGLEQILQARERAEADRLAIEDLLALRPPVPQIALLAEATRLMQDTEWRPDLWSQPNPETLEVRFTAPRMDGEAIVAAWEASPLFSDVTPSLASRGDGMTLNARVQRSNEDAAE